MNDDLMTCERVAVEDVDVRYLAGRLSDAEATAFEQHYFACDRCWGLVQEGLALRDGLAGEPKPGARPSSWPWWGLAAAGVVAVGLGTWAVSGPNISPAPDEVRGRAPLAVHATADSGAIAAAWAQVPEADIYRVRLFAADGTLLHERQVSDTTISIPLDSVAGREGDAYWDVEALDRLRDPLGRSDMVRAVFPADSP